MAHGLSPPFFPMLSCCGPKSCFLASRSHPLLAGYATADAVILCAPMQGPSASNKLLVSLGIFISAPVPRAFRGVRRPVHVLGSVGQSMFYEHCQELRASPHHHPARRSSWLSVSRPIQRQPLESLPRLSPSNGFAVGVMHMQCMASHRPSTSSWLPQR